MAEKYPPNLEFRRKELTIKEVIQTHSLPVIVKTCVHGEYETFQRELPEDREMLLQRVMCVKYACVQVLASDAKETQDEQKHNDETESCFLLPVKYHGKLRFVHRPGKRRRYTSVSQILHDLPRFITVWQNTTALQSGISNKYITVEANTTLEIIRKVRKPENKTTVLECSNGESLVAFCDKDRLNCTAIDDTKLYYLFELVRSKLLPRVFHFEGVDENDISHADSVSYSKTLAAIDAPIDLLGFEDVDVLVGCIRNEILETYETVLIPKKLWSSLKIHQEPSRAIADMPAYVASLYGPCADVAYVENSLYLLPFNQNKVMWLNGPAFTSKGNISSSLPCTVEHGEMKHQGPVVLLPLVKKQKTRFKKVHQELLRMFKSKKNEKSVPKHIKSVPERLEAKSKTRHYKKCALNRVSRSSSLNDLLSPPTYKECTKKIDVESSDNIEFHSDDTVHQPSINESVRLRMSVSTGDIRDTLPSLSGNYSEIDETPVVKEERLEAKSKTRHNKKGTLNRVSRSSSLNDLLSPPTYKECTKKSDVDSSDYIEFHSDDTVHQTSINESHLRISVSMGDIRDTLSDDYSEIDFTQVIKEEVKAVEAQFGTVATGLSTCSNYGQETYLDMHPTDFKETHSATMPTALKRTFGNGKTTGSYRQANFYRYTVVETYECLKECGLEELALTCKANKLDGSFFRHFSIEELKEDPFNMSNFNIFKVWKIIREGWRPT